MSAAHRPNRMADAAHRPDTPKRLRRREPVVIRALVDPMATLGHPARPRKR